MRRNSLAEVVNRLLVARLRHRSLFAGGQEYFIFLRSSRPNLKPNKSSIEWKQRTVPLPKMLSERADQSLLPSADIKNAFHSTICHLGFMFRLSQGQLCLASRCVRAESRKHLRSLYEISLHIGTKQILESMSQVSGTSHRCLQLRYVWPRTVTCLIVTVQLRVIIFVAVESFALKPDTGYDFDSAEV